MKYLSVCSGIEAATVAWHSMGWGAVAFSEIDKFPSAVLAHHYPDVPNLGDMTKYESWKIGAVDILVGGTPCQAFSISGRRGGLDDARGNLALTFCEIADHFGPEWVLWENVPGVLSDKTNAFGCLLGRLCGAGDALLPPAGRSWPCAGVVSGPDRTAAWRVLDAQYLGVAQQRRRVFVLAARGAGNWRCAAALLPVGDGVQGDPAARRKAAKDIAGTIDACAARSRGAGHNPGILTAGSLTKSMGKRGGCPDAGDTPGQLIVSHDPAVTLTRREYKGPLPEADLSTVVAYTVHGTPASEVASRAEVSQCLRSRAPGGVENSSSTVVAFRHWASASDTGCPQADIAPTLRKSDVHGQSVMIPAVGVRRLTPRECERLQGFPDDYTAIPRAADGPRYAAIGNSMAVPVMRWIAERIEFVEANF